MKTGLQEHFQSLSERFGKTDAAVIGPELLRLVQDGCTTPQEVVDAARPEGSQLHLYFEWNDTVAAERYRQGQAIHMVRSIAYRVETPEGPAQRTFNVIWAKGLPEHKGTKQASHHEIAPVEGERFCRVCGKQLPQLNRSRRCFSCEDKGLEEARQIPEPHIRQVLIGYEKQKAERRERYEYLAKKAKDPLCGPTMVEAAIDATIAYGRATGAVEALTSVLSKV